MIRQRGWEHTADTTPRPKLGTMEVHHTHGSLAHTKAVEQMIRQAAKEHSRYNAKGS